MICLILPCLSFANYLRWIFHYDLQLGIFHYYQEFYEHSTRGQLPWIHYDLEYPPLSIPFIFGPVLLMKGLSMIQVTILRGVWSLVITLFAIYQLVAYELKVRKIPFASLTVGSSLLASGALYFMVYDWIPMCLILLAFVLRNESAKSKVASTLLLVVGLFTKLVPGLIYPWVTQGKANDPWWKRHGILIAFVAFHVVYGLINLKGTMWAIQYHVQRPIDAYGIYGVITMLLGRLGISPEKVITLNLTEEMAGPVSAIFQKLSTLVFLALVIFTFIRYRRTEKTLEDRWIAGILTVVAFTLFGKLGQANYCFWVVASAVVLGLFPSTTSKQLWTLGLCSVGFCVFATMQGKTSPHLLDPVVPLSVILFGLLKFLLGLPIIQICARKLRAPAAEMALTI